MDACLVNKLLGVHSHLLHQILEQTPEQLIYISFLNIPPLRFFKQILEQKLVAHFTLET